eukprot:1177404-Prorocentrum_minimum.AAC.3
MFILNRIRLLAGGAGLRGHEGAADARLGRGAQLGGAAGGRLGRGQRRGGRLSAPGTNLGNSGGAFRRMDSSEGSVPWRVASVRDGAEKTGR